MAWHRFGSDEAWERGQSVVVPSSGCCGTDRAARRTGAERRGEPMSRNPDTARREAWSGTVLERQALAFHYRHVERHGDIAFPPDLIHKRSFMDGVGVVYMGSTGARHTALYFFSRYDIGDRFRPLHTELEGVAVSRALLKAKAFDLPALAELGLSMREIAVLSKLDLAQVRKLLGSKP